MNIDPRFPLDHSPPVRNDRLSRHLLIGFGLTLAIYVGIFSCDQGLRRHKGPWVVTFSQTNGAPFISISQPSSGITNIQVVFQGETATNTQETVHFDRPSKSIPFGKTKFEDLTYLPGSVAFDFFGHEVELLPRTLYLNKKEQGWTSGKTYILKPEEKLPPESFVDPKKKKKR